MSGYALLICLLQIVFSTALAMMFGSLDEGDTYSDYLVIQIRHDLVMAFTAFFCFVFYGKKSSEYLHVFIILGLVTLLFHLILSFLPESPKSLVLISLQYILLISGGLLGMKIGQVKLESTEITKR